MKFAQSRDGTKIAYAIAGSGPPLLLVHGALAEHGRWQPVLPALQQKFTVATMERRGRGASGDAPAYDLQREAEDIAAVVDSIGGQVDVVAHSYGAVCAVEASLLTGNIRRLALYEPLIQTEPQAAAVPELDTIERQARAGDREAALRAFFRDIFKMPDVEIEKLSKLPYWDERLAVIHTAPREARASRSYRFQPEAFAAMNTPVLFMLGTDSPPPFKATVEVLRAGLKVTETAMLKGQQHQAMVTAPALFVDEVIRFFDPR